MNTNEQNIFEVIRSVTNAKRPDDVLFNLAAEALRSQQAELEALKAKLAEVERENERLKTVPMKYRRMEFNAQLQNEVRQLEEKLAAIRQAVVSTLPMDRNYGKSAFVEMPLKSWQAILSAAQPQEAQP